MSHAPTPKATRSKAAALSVDASLKADLKNMATTQETWITDHVTTMGLAVKATKPGGTAKVGPYRFHASPGNVIAVKVGNDGYCISGYNKTATKATSAKKSLLYKSAKGGIQTRLGVC